MLHLTPVAGHFLPLLNGFPHLRHVELLESARALYPDLLGDDFLGGNLPIWGLLFLIGLPLDGERPLALKAFFAPNACTESLGLHRATVEDSVVALSNVCAIVNA